MSMNILLFILALVVNSQVNASLPCENPPLLNEQLPPNLAHAGDMVIERDGDDLYLTCPESSQWILKQAATGTLIPSTAEIKCIGNTWITETDVTLAPEDLFACVEGKINPKIACIINFNGFNQEILVGDSYKTCQSGQTTRFTINGNSIDGTKLKCVRAGTVSVDDEEHQYDNTAHPRQVVMECADESTAPTTTISSC